MACDPPSNAPSTAPSVLRRALLPMSSDTPVDVSMDDATSAADERDHVIVVCAPIVFENVLACAAQCRLSRRRNGAATDAVVVLDELIASGDSVDVYGVDSAHDTLELQVCSVFQTIVLFLVCFFDTKKTLLLDSYCWLSLESIDCVESTTN